jgi:hypothetical protein
MSAVETVLTLALGQRFTLRGRTYSLSSWSGWSHYEGYSVVPVWNERGRETRIKIKDADRIEVA